MIRFVQTGITACALVAILASAALAAPPTKGGVYEGTLHASGVAALTKQVRVKVAASGTTARVTWKCGTNRGSNLLQFPIAADGTFKASSTTGSLTVWSFAGTFVSKQLVRAVLRLNATCDGKGGALKLALGA